MVLNLQVTLILGSKQGPVMLTMVPPSMWPFSGANVKGKLVPTIKKDNLLFVEINLCKSVHSNNFATAQRGKNRRKN